MITSLVKSLRLPQLNSLHDLIPLSNSGNSLKSLLETEKLHAQLLKFGDLNQLPRLYLNCGALIIARKLFEEITNWDLVSATSIIGAFARCNCHHDSIYMFSHLLSTDARPNEFTFSTAIHSVSALCDINTGKQLHACAVKMGLNSNFNLEDSMLVFNRLENRNTVSWNSIICGYARNGKAKEALQLYKKMRDLSIKPNDYTLHGLLFACNHAGLTEDGYRLFRLVKKEQPEILKSEHYASLIDLFCRAGRYDDAKWVLEEEVHFDPGIEFWKALTGGHRIYYNKEVTQLIAQKIKELGPKDSSSYVLLSNMYCAIGKWDDASQIRREIKEKGMKRITGSSWIEIKNEIHVFSNGYCTHPQNEEIYMMLNFLNQYLM